MADECELATSCPVEERQEQLDIEDPSISILPETEAGPVEAGPPVVTGPLTPCNISLLQQYNFKPLINFSKLAGNDPDAAASFAAVAGHAAVASFAAAALTVAGHDAAAAAAAAGYDAAAAFSIVNQVATKAKDDAAAEGNVPTETQQRDDYGFIDSDEVASNSSEHITKGEFNPVSVSFQIMGYIESQIKTDLLRPFDMVFDTLYKGLSVCVPDLPGDGATKGFVGINKCGFLSKYT